MSGVVLLCTVTEYTGRCKCQGLSFFVQWLNIPDAANVRGCPTVYSDWIYRTLQMSGVVRLCTVTEYTGRCKCQGLSFCVQWLKTIYRVPQIPPYIPVCTASENVATSLRKFWQAALFQSTKETEIVPFTTTCLTYASVWWCERYIQYTDMLYKWTRCTAWGCAMSTSILRYSLCLKMSYMQNMTSLHWPRNICLMSVKWHKCLLILRRLMSYIYGAPILAVSRSHTTTQHSR